MLGSMRITVCNATQFYTHFKVGQLVTFHKIQQQISRYFAQLRQYKGNLDFYYLKIHKKVKIHKIVYSPKDILIEQNILKHFHDL